MPASEWMTQGKIYKNIDLDHVFSILNLKQFEGRIKSIEALKSAIYQEHWASAKIQWVFRKKECKEENFNG